MQYKESIDAYIEEQKEILCDIIKRCKILEKELHAQTAAINERVKVECDMKYIISAGKKICELNKKIYDITRDDFLEPDKRKAQI